MMKASLVATNEASNIKLALWDLNIQFQNRNISNIII
jgi:hypothetical protein